MADSFIELKPPYYSALTMDRLQYTEAISIKGANITIDLGLGETVYREVWNKSEKERTTGIDNLTFVNYNLINNC